ncbi:hypothetical protein D3C81_2037000 [compost metagenome]
MLHLRRCGFVVVVNHRIVIGRHQIGRIVRAIQRSGILAKARVQAFDGRANRVARLGGGVVTDIAANRSAAGHEFANLLTARTKIEQLKVARANGVAVLGG